jgi:hypothetical protein
VHKGAVVALFTSAMLEELADNSLGSTVVCISMKLVFLLPVVIVHNNWYCYRYRYR